MTYFLESFVTDNFGYVTGFESPSLKVVNKEAFFSYVDHFVVME